MLGVATPKVARYGGQPIWGAYTRTAIIARTDWEKYDAEIKLDVFISVGLFRLR